MVLTRDPRILGELGFGQATFNPPLQDVGEQPPWVLGWGTSEQDVGHRVTAETGSPGLKLSWEQRRRLEAGGKALSRTQEPGDLFPCPGPHAFPPG